MTKKTREETDIPTIQERKDAIEDLFSHFAVTIRAITIRSYSDHKTAVIKLYPFAKVHRDLDNFITLNFQFNDKVSNKALCLGILRVFEEELEGFIDDNKSILSDDAIMNAPDNAVTKFMTNFSFDDDDDNAEDLSDSYSLQKLVDGFEMVRMELNHTLFSVADVIY